MAAKQTKGHNGSNARTKNTGNRSKNAKQAVRTTRQKGSSNDVNKRGNKISDEMVDDGIIKDEIILVITLLASLLLILSYVNLCGPIGKGINTVMFGLIGWLAYVFPFALFLMTAFYLSNRGNQIAKRKLYSGIGLLFVLASMLQMIKGYDAAMSIPDYFIQGAKKTGGGLLGGIFVKPLCSLFGPIATVVILIALFIICIMLITGKAIISWLKELGEESLEHRRVQRLEREALEYDPYEYDEQVETRRRPRIVSFQKVPKPVEEKITERAEEPAVSFLDKLKQKGKEGVKESNHKSIDTSHESGYDMKEIVDGNPSDFSITGDFRPTDSMIQEVNAIYEEELQKKFGQKEESLVQASAMNETTFEHHASTETQKVDTYKMGTEAEGNKQKELHGGIDQTSKQDVHKKGSNTDATGKQEAGDLVEPMNINQTIEEPKKYVFPPIDLLGKPKIGQRGMTDKDLKETAVKLQKTLESFGVRVTITNISCGPAVTRYELQPEQGVKVSKITGLADDIKLNLAAADVRIEAPIPGKAAVGIEVPNKENSAVMLRELLDTKEFKEHSSDIAFAVGKDIGGQAVVTDIAKMPHLLIAGATGSGKSVCINTLIMSILYKANPADVRMIMVDPKVVELSVYNGIPHLLIPVVTDPKKASAALNWAVMEMTDRYKKFADLGVRDLKGYNERVAEIKELNDPNYQKLPQIVIIVDELADLMMVAPGEVEDAICRLAQMARAAGLHLIIATQRPSVNVITGLIKANVPSRIAFSVSSAIDSRTIIDGSGAEKLLGKGDMLFFPSGYPKPVRVQGAFVSDKEVSAVVDFLKEQNQHVGYNEEVSNQITSVQTIVENGSAGSSSDRDDYFVEAGKFIIEKDKASIGMLQRVYKIGFNRAARIMDQLADAGVVGPEEGTKPRKVLMSLEEFEQYIEEYV